MLHKEEFLRTHPEVHTGMTAYGTDGERLGVIERTDDDTITIEKGRIFHKDIQVPYDDIEDVRAEDVIIRRSFLEEERTPEGEVGPLRGERAASEERIPPRAEVKVPERTREEEFAGSGSEEEFRGSGREEELEAQKREKEGEVSIHKDVYTETKHMEVPVQKEKVRVEHVPVSETGAESMDENAFQEQDIRIPVREEEVEVTKRPVVKDEIRVSKEAYEETEEVTGEVRKEKVKVDRTEPARRR